MSIYKEVLRAAGTPFDTGTAGLGAMNMGDAPKPVPDGFHTVTAYLVVRDAPEAIEFYKEAFGATERLRLTDRERGRVRHAELQIGDSRLFVTDIALAPETRVPDADDTTPVWLYMYVADPDALFDRAVQAGADVVTPMGNQPWGDRYGCLRDPFGYRWGIAARCETLTKDELEVRMQHAYAED